jgi:serine/threonine-protein kinase
VPPGTRLTNDQAIVVAVSRGPAPAVMPDLRQRRLEEARADLTAAGLVVGQIIERETPRQPWGVVIEQRIPAGSALPRQALVDLTVAVPPWTTVPTLLDRSLGEVEQELERSGLRLGAVRLEPTAGKRAGTVVAQELAPGLRVRHGERVTVTIAVPPP